MKTVYYGDFPGIPDGFPNPNGHESYTRGSAISEFSPQSYLSAIEDWFKNHEGERP